MFFWGLRFLGLGLLGILVLPVGSLVLGASWQEVWAAAFDAEVFAALGISVLCAGLAALVGVGLGVPAGYLLAQPDFRWRRLISTLVDLPLVVPHPVIGLGLLLVFGQRRMVGAALHDGLGLEVASAWPGIVLAMVVVSAPFIVKAARDAFLRLPADYAQTARSLGAGDFVVFWRVTLPNVRQPIAAGALMAWARAVSEFGSVMVLAYFPRTAPVVIWDRFSTRGLQAAVAPALVLCAVCVAFFFLAQPIAQGAGPDE